MPPSVNIGLKIDEKPLHIVLIIVATVVIVIIDPIESDIPHSVED